MKNYSIIFEENIQEGASVNKGDMLGYFLFGGSDYVMIFQKNAGFELTALKDENNSQSYKHILMGEEYGVLSSSK